MSVKIKVFPSSATVGYKGFRMDVRADGFTLVEVMIVAAIIGILAGLTLPNFIRASKMAKKILCQNNLKLIYNVKELYLFDHPEIEDDTLISPSEFCGEGNYIKEDASDLCCPEGHVQYPSFWMDLGPVCPHGPDTTEPPGDGTFPEHIRP